MKEKMIRVLEYFVKELVDDKKAVKIDCEETDDSIVMHINLAENDRGAVIGINGKRIKALKEIVHMEGFKTGKKVRLEVI